MLCVTEFLQSADCRRGRSSASSSKNHRTALYCRPAFLLAAVRKSASEVPLRFIDALRYAPDIVRSQPRTASLLSGNSVLRADFFRRRVLAIRCPDPAAGGARPPAVGTTAQPYTAGRPTPPRQLSVFQRFCAGRARGEPSVELPAAHVRRQWFMTKEEGVRLRSSLFLENGSACVCMAIFAEPIAPKSTKLQVHGIIVSL